MQLDGSFCATPHLALELTTSLAHNTLHPCAAECADIAGPEDDAQREYGGAAG